MKMSGLWRSVMKAAALALGALAFAANAEIFYGGETQGFPGDPVHLTLHARAGTILEALDIAPFYDEVAGVLDSGTLTVTNAFSDGGLATCENEVCGVFYVTPKTFTANELLATISFTIAPGAPVGPVDFDPGVIVNVTPLDIPQELRFEVLAIPEPSNWALLLAGLAVLILAVPRCRRAQARFGARRAAVLRGSRRWIGLPRRELSR